MVEKSVETGDSVSKVHGRAELVRVPCQVNVERRYCDLRLSAFGHDGEITIVLDEKPLHGKFSGWRMDPVDSVHLLNECTLTNDCTDKVKRKGRSVVPVAGHHAAQSNSLFFRRFVGISRLNVVRICKALLDLIAHAIHGTENR